MSGYNVKKTLGDTKWFTHDRFGMFIHWGIYAVPARGEWYKTTNMVPDDEYDRYVDYFNPDLYDPREWARTARKAGMKYVVFTTKHHDGFCMWDTAYTDYKCTNSPAARDLLREFVDAFRAEGLHIGLYYSLLDWHHPQFPIDSRHPRRSDPNAGELNKGRNMKIYTQYMRDQVEELLSNYGKIDIMWYDFSYNEFPERDMANPYTIGFGKDDWESEKLIELTRRLQPGIIINNRCDIDQDIWTPEQFQPHGWVTHPKTGELVTWETCQTFSGAWGYHRDEYTWKSPEMLIQMLVNTVSTGGNLIINVGPTARGYFDKRACDSLKVYEEWMKYNSDSIYGCTMAEPEFTAPNGFRYTQSEDGKRLFVHLFNYPFAKLELPGLAEKVEFARFLHDGSELTFHNGNSGHDYSENYAPNYLFIDLPVIKPDFIVPVVELTLK